LTKVRSESYNHLSNVQKTLA